MSSNGISIRDWLDSMVEAMNELAPTTLGFDDVEVKEIKEVFPVGMSGAYIALVSMDSSLQIGLVSEPKGCETLALSLMGMEPGEEELSEQDIADSVGEIINILAGMIKRQMAKKINAVNLGLPIFINGHIEPRQRQETGVAEVKIGPVDAQLLVLREAE